MRPRPSARGLRLTLAAALLGLGSCSPVIDGPGPVVLIGVDGLEWNVVLPLIREGRMPALEGLMRRGSFGTLSTQAPAKSPVIWTTVATGKAPPKHGILDFTRQDASGELALYSSTDRTTKALWNILGDAGQTSAVVGWWTTFPAEAIAGVMVSQLNSLRQVHRRKLLRRGGIERGVAGQVYPAAREDEVLEIVEQVDRELPRLLRRLYPQAFPGDSPAEVASWQSCRWSFRADESTRRIALRLARTQPFPDALLVYFGATDVVSHRFWRFHQPQVFRHPPSAERVRRLGDVVARTYEHVDAVVGELIAELPDDATIFVISDHGMRPKRRRSTFKTGPKRQLERESAGHGTGPPGLLVAAGPAVRRAETARPIRQLTRADLPPVGDVADITPTILFLRRVAIGRDMDGSVLEDLLRPEIVAARDPELVASHDTEEWRAARRRREAVERPGSGERLEQLRSLGYLGRH